jgi:urease subunit alpha
MLPMWGAFGSAPQAIALTFVSQAARDAGLPERSAGGRRFATVGNVRALGKRDMVGNTALPRIEVDPQTYEVRADGELLQCEPLAELPLAQRYALF